MERGAGPVNYLQKGGVKRCTISIRPCDKISGSSQNLQLRACEIGEAFAMKTGKP